MKILITGGAGFIGSNLAKRLVDDGHDVVVLDSLLRGNKLDKETFAKIKFIKGDVRDYDTVQDACVGCDLIFHFAAVLGVDIVAYINAENYKQHNLDVGDGLEGFGAVLQNAPEGGFKANVVRSFQDGEFVFTHTVYDFFGPKVGFDVFRFEDGKIVEHWDNLAEIAQPNPSGRTQTDGTTELTDIDKTDENKAVVQQFVDEVLLNGKMDNLTTLVNPEKYLQHNSAVADGLDGLGAALQYFAENNMVMIYDEVHKVLGEGNFVLTMSEGKFGEAPGNHVAFYDLFRLENGQIVEHWDVIQPIPAESEWKNSNGKF